MTIVNTTFFACWFLFLAFSPTLPATKNQTSNMKKARKIPSVHRKTTTREIIFHNTMCSELQKRKQDNWRES